MIRKAAVAGYFYPGTKAALEKELKVLLVQAGKKKPVRGVVSPHAGYVYSGGCAGKVFGSIDIPDTVIVLGVNHHGAGPLLAVDGHDFWETPLGNIAVNETLRSQVIKQTKYFKMDKEAGRFEHSLEVQVPFLQYLNPHATILPIMVADRHLDSLLEAGKELGRLYHDYPRLLIVASSDMSHYIPADKARELDFRAIAAILNLDPQGLFNTVIDNDISMCGVAPTVIMLKAAIEGGAKKAELVDYTHSGEKTGDFSEVVAYAGLTIQ